MKPQADRPGSRVAHHSPGGVIWLVAALAVGLAACNSKPALTPTPSPPTLTPAPPTVTLVTPPPTPPCVRPTLTFGAHKFNIEALKRAADGSIPVPPDAAATAFWIDGTNAHYVFALSPTADNLDLRNS